MVGETIALAWREDAAMKRSGIAGSLALVCALVLALVGCSSGPADEEVIRQGVSEELAAIKTGDDDLAAAVEQGAGDDIQKLGLDSKEFMEAYLEGFDYEVGDVSVQGTAATVHLSITCRSMADIASDFESKYVDAVAGAADATDDDALYKLAGQTLLQCVREASPKRVECDVACQKGSDGTWTYADGVKDQVTQLFLS